MKQIIIARKDLGMSPGKLSTQVSHASMAFLSSIVVNNTTQVNDSRYMKFEVYRYDFFSKKREKIWYRHPDLYKLSEKAIANGKDYFWIYQENGEYSPIIEVDDEENIPKVTVTNIRLSDKEWGNIIAEWFKGDYTKVVCEAKNKNHLLKVVDIAKEIGLKENIDYFIIRDRCFTELTPEETDDNGNGVCITCIGFRPLSDDICKQLSKKYQLYK